MQAAFRTNENCLNPVALSCTLARSQTSQGFQPATPAGLSPARKQAVSKTTRFDTPEPNQ